MRNKGCMSLFSLIVIVVFSLPHCLFASPSAAGSRGKHKVRKPIVVKIFNADQLLALQARPVPLNSFAQGAFDNLFNQLTQGLAEGNMYHLMFSKKLKSNKFPQLGVVSKGRVLEHILRSPLGEETCATWYNVNEETLTAGEDLSTTTSGVCGPISILNSLVRLGIKSREDVVSGEFLNASELQAVKTFQAGLKGIKIAEVKAAYANFGAPNCMESELIRTVSRIKLGIFNQELKAKMDSTDPVWDCNLDVYNINTSGVKFLAHTEQVQSVMQVGKGKRPPMRIMTLNTLTQGNQSTTVPANPGTNTWVSSPGRKNRSMLLGGSTAPLSERRKFARQVPLVTHTRYVCCRR
jgi:hypothetical protein